MPVPLLERPPAPCSPWIGGELKLAPAPPDEDVLKAPVFLLKPPRIVLPERGGLKEWLEVLNPWRRDEARQKRKLHALIASVMDSVAPRTVWDMEKRGRLSPSGRPKSDLRQFRITHPYQLRDAFFELVSGSHRHFLEYKAIEVLLAMILREYARTASQERDGRFSFESAARRHGLQAYHLERQIVAVTDPDERLGVVRKVHEKYLHMVNYYGYSVVSRERATNEGTLFSMYCRAVFFLARVERDGTLRAKVDRQRLPRRRDVLFLILRDQGVRRRYNRDTSYADRLKEIVRYFPSERR